MSVNDAMNLAEMFSKQREESNKIIIQEMSEEGNEDVWKVAQELYNIVCRDMNHELAPLTEQNESKQAKYLTEALYAIQHYNFVKGILKQ